MMEEILKAIGTSAVVPIASIAVAGYAITMLTGFTEPRASSEPSFSAYGRAWNRWTIWR